MMNTLVKFTQQLIGLLVVSIAITACSGGGGGGTPASTTYTIGGILSGLAGTVVLQNNGGDDLTLTADGSFSFSTALGNGAAYSVTVSSQPSGKNCQVSNGSGTVSGANVTDITVVCSDMDPTGYYTNTGTASVLQNDNVTPRAIITDLQGMATTTQLMMVSDSQQVAYSGTISISNNNFTGTVTVYEAAVATQSNVPVSGTIIQGSSITGILSGTDVANGTFALNYALAADNGTVTNAQITFAVPGWDPVTNTDYMRIGVENILGNNVSTGGTASSALFDNCDNIGRIDPVAGTHLYTITTNLSNCVNPLVQTATYAGLVSVRGSNPNDRLIVVLTNGSYGITGEFKR